MITFFFFKRLPPLTSYLTDTGCPFGWMITDNSCYYFSNFTDPTQILTWNDAKQWCANKQFSAGAAKLVTLDNPNDGVSRFVDPSDDFKEFQLVNFKYRN